MSKHMWVETREYLVEQMPCVTAVCACGWDVDALKGRGWLTKVRSAFKYHQQFPNEAANA